MDVLSEYGDFQILHISRSWQHALISRFYGNNDYLPDLLDVNKPMYANHDSAQSYMYVFLKQLYTHLKVDCVISPTYRYLDDYDWSLASKKLGVPYIILYRECLLNAKIYEHIVTKRTSKFPKFHGDHIIVHNQICKDMFIKSGFCKENQVSDLGALRMDKFIRRINAKKEHYTQNRRKIFVLFY